MKKAESARIPFFGFQALSYRIGLQGYGSPVNYLRFSYLLLPF